MSGEPLAIRTFAEIIRERMNKNAYIRNYDSESNEFESAENVRINHEAVDASEVYPFYKLLLDSVIYLAVETGEEGLPDIAAPMVTQLKNGTNEVHSKIKEIAQRKEARRIVADFFEANLIPNIPDVVLPMIWKSAEERNQYRTAAVIAVF